MRVLASHGFQAAILPGLRPDFAFSSVIWVRKISSFEWLGGILGVQRNRSGWGVPCSPQAVVGDG